MALSIKLLYERKKAVFVCTKKGEMAQKFMHANINRGCDYESVYRYFERSDKILTECQMVECISMIIFNILSTTLFAAHKKKKFIKTLWKILGNLFKSLNLENLNISKLIEKQLQPLKSSSSHLNIRRLIHSKLFIWNCSSIFCVAGKRGMVSKTEKSLLVLQHNRPLQPSC